MKLFFGLIGVIGVVWLLAIDAEFNQKISRAQAKVNQKRAAKAQLQQLVIELNNLDKEVSNENN